MTGRSKDMPGSSEDGRRRAAERKARRAEALRANLKKRKAQQRGRAADPKGGDGCSAKD